MRERIINVSMELVPSAKMRGSVAGNVCKVVLARHWLGMQSSQKDASVDWAVKAQPLN